MDFRAQYQEDIRLSVLVASIEEWNVAPWMKVHFQELKVVCSVEQQSYQIILGELPSPRPSEQHIWRWRHTRYCTRRIYRNGNSLVKPGCSALWVTQFWVRRPEVFSIADIGFEKPSSRQKYLRVWSGVSRFALNKTKHRNRHCV
jgi:hypothetical protein